MASSLTADACMIKIEQLREKMMTTAMEYGIDHPLVLKYSQELDHAHNVMLRLHASCASKWDSVAL